MKKLLTLTLATTLALGLPTIAFAQKKKMPAEAKKAEAKPEAAAAPAAEKNTATKSLPMNARVDSMDASAKTFTMKRKDGVEVKHILTDATEIKNSGADAKLEDIKVGDWVSGSRTKKSNNEYEVVKITKFGPSRAKREKLQEGAKPDASPAPVNAEPKDSVPEAKKP